MLEGVRVLDLSQVIAGPVCTRLMAEMGADVVKVELAPGGDHGRSLPSIRQGRSAYFAQHNQGKRGVCVDPRHPATPGILRKLVAGADVLIENFSPGAIGRLGLDWDTVHAINPRTVMCSISAFGQTGPLRDLPGFDYIAQAYAGVTSMIGDPDGAPALTGLAVGDVGTGMTALAAINAALFRRERDGRGRHIDISILDFYFHANEMSVEMASLGDWKPHRTGSHHGAIAPMGVFAARDGYLYIVALDAMWPRVCAAMKRPDLVEDPRFATNALRVVNRDALIATIQDWLAGLAGRDDAVHRLEAARVPVAPVLSIEEAMNHPHMIERGTVRTIADPVLGPFKGSGNPLRFSDSPGTAPVRAPFLGEHNRDVLRSLAGFADAEIDALERDGALVAEALPPGSR